MMKCKKDDGVKVCGEDEKMKLGGFLMGRQDQKCLMVMEEVMKREDLTEVTDNECECLTKYDLAEVEAESGFMADSCGVDGKESLKARMMKCKKDDGVKVCGEEEKMKLGGFLMEKQDQKCLMVMEEVMKREDLTEVTDNE